MGCKESVEQWKEGYRLVAQASPKPARPRPKKSAPRGGRRPPGKQTTQRPR